MHASCLLCELVHSDQVYLCPCHDAIFGKQGEVLDGPPPRALDRYEEFRVTAEGILEIFYKEA